MIGNNNIMRLVVRGRYVGCRVAGFLSPVCYFRVVFRWFPSFKGGVIGRNNMLVEAA